MSWLAGAARQAGPSARSERAEQQVAAHMLLLSAARNLTTFIRPFKLTAGRSALAARTPTPTTNARNHSRRRPAQLSEPHSHSRARRLASEPVAAARRAFACSCVADAEAARTTASGLWRQIHGAVVRALVGQRRRAERVGQRLSHGQCGQRRAWRAARRVHTFTRRRARRGPPSSGRRARRGELGVISGPLAARRDN